MNMQNVYLALSWLRVDVSSKFVFEGVASSQRVLFIYLKERRGVCYTNMIITKYQENLSGESSMKMNLMILFE